MNSNSIQYFRQLAVLVNSGVPLFSSLELLSTPRGESIEWDSTVQEVLTDVETGSSFSRALAKHPKYFSQTQVQAIASAEIAGRLAHTLRWIDEWNEMSEKVRRKLIQAALYPALVVCVTLLVSFALFKTVLPKILTVGQPPEFLPSRLLSWMVAAVDSGYFLLFLIPLLVGVWVIPRSQELKLKFYEVGMHLPVTQKLLVNLASLRFASNLTLMLQSGAMMTVALGQAIAASGNPIVQARQESILNSISNGATVTETLRIHDALFSDPLVQMLMVAEETGRYGACLDRAIEYLEREVNSQIDLVLQLLEPLLLVTISGFVAFIALGSIVPVLQLASQF